MAQSGGIPTYTDSCSTCLEFRKNNKKERSSVVKQIKYNFIIFIFKMSKMQ